MSSVFLTLQERGFIAQMTAEESIRELLDQRKIRFYIGFDPTADSLHVGHFLQMMVMRHLQKAGHTPICIIGGGTTMVGDPSGKTDMRRMMTQETISKNAEIFKAQMSKFIDFSDGKAWMLNNADWLLNLKYIDFLREVGVHFSVNRMLSAECFKSRLERGLSFIEFNYMLMQSYDFLKLYRDYDCVMQLGGDDQWSNILGGIDLVRRVEGAEVYGMTFNLLTTSDGKKMGKTEKGAVWLDEKKTPPYEFYQYWRNIHDADVEKCLKLLTVLPLDQIEQLCAPKDERINVAKETLAYSLTELVHGTSHAKKAQQTARSLFTSGQTTNDMPKKSIDADVFGQEMPVIELLNHTSLTSSKSEARRLIRQGGLTINDQRILDETQSIKLQEFGDEGLIVRVGKKKYFRIAIKYKES